MFQTVLLKDQDNLFKIHLYFIIKNVCLYRFGFKNISLFWKKDLQNKVSYLSIIMTFKVIFLFTGFEYFNLQRDSNDKITFYIKCL